MPGALLLSSGALRSAAAGCWPGLTEYRLTVRGLPKEHAVAALNLYAPPNTRAGRYTTPAA